MEVPTFRRRCVRWWVWKDNHRCGRKTARIPPCLRSLLLTHDMTCSWRPHRKDKVWSVSLWHTFFAMTVGSYIPVIVAIPPWLQKFARDALGELRAPPIRLHTTVPVSASVVRIADRLRLNCDLVRLLFVQTHWNPTTFKFVSSGCHLVQSNQFHYRRAKFSSHVESRVGNILPKSHPYCPSHAQASRLLISSLSVVEPVPHTSQYNRHSDPSVVPFSF